MRAAGRTVIAKKRGNRLPATLAKKIRAAMAVNVPLNDAIKAAGDPDRINVAQVRDAFNESKWAACNYVRVAAASGAADSNRGVRPASTS